MISTCPLCGYNGELNTTSKDPTLYVCLRCFLIHYAEGVTPMSWNDIAGKGSGKKDQDVLSIAPNTAKLVHILLADNDEPTSYWTHYIPSKSTSGPKGRVIICPGMDTCPACRVGTYQTKRVHAVNVWDYDLKTVKIMEGGKTIFQALKQIKDQIGTLSTVDISIKKSGSGLDTSYSIIPIPMMQPFNNDQIKGIFQIGSLRIPNTVEEIQQTIDQMERGIQPPKEGPTPISQSLPPSTFNPGGIGNPPPQQQPATSNSAPVFPFGKYKGRSVADVYAEDPNYVKWCSENITDANIKAEAKKLVETPKPVISPTTSPDKAWEDEQNAILSGEVSFIIQNDTKYKGNYGVVLEKMRSVSKSPIHPNGKTLLNEYTVVELTALLAELKKG